MSSQPKYLPYYEKYMLLMGTAGHLIHVFQAHKILSNKSAADVSLPGFLIAFLSILSWFFYGILKKDKVLIYVNGFGLLASATCLIAILKFN